MELKRLSANIFALSIVAAFALFLALPATAAAQQPANNGTGYLSLPLSFIIDNTLDNQAQDIQENIFDYKINATGNDTGRQSAILEQRSEQLAGDANDKKAFLRALIAKNGTIPAVQAAGMADSVGASVDRLDNSAKKLEDHVAQLATRNGHSANASDFQPLITNIQDTKGLSNELKNKNHFGGNGINPNAQGFVPKKK